MLNAASLFLNRHKYPKASLPKFYLVECIYIQ